MGNPSAEKRPHGLTRRAALAGAATAGAAVAAAGGSAASLAAAIAGPPVFSRFIGRVKGETQALRAPRRFALLGVEWAGPQAIAIELRTRSAGAGWSPWVPASVGGHGPDRPREHDARFGEPVWTGDADLVQLRAAAPVEGVTLHFVAVSAIPSASASAAAALPLAMPVLEAGPGQPPIIARSAWAHGNAPPAVPPAYGEIKLAFVHHTDNPNGYGAGQGPSLIFAMYLYHRHVRGYNDLGYNFVIDAFGRIWEAREGGIDRPVIGAQAGGYNTESTGVAVLGTFVSVLPPPAAIAALERLLAWKMSLHGLPTRGRVTVVVDPADAFYTPFAPGAHVSLHRIAGHRDGDSTDCPGNDLYAQLPAIRSRIAGLVGSVARITLATRTPVATAGTPGTAAGRLTDLTGAPLAGAPVEIQQLLAGREQTLAQAATAADGSFAVPVTLSENALLRALHRPAPATVSGVLSLGVAPLITLTLESASPLRVSGTVTPAGPPVTVELLSAAAPRRKPVRSKPVAAAGGSFSAALPAPHPGRYLLRAVTAATADHVAGASAPISVTV
jgi:hypothetical protein